MSTPTKLKQTHELCTGSMLDLAADSYTRLKLSDGQPNVTQRLLQQALSHSGLEVAPLRAANHQGAEEKNTAWESAKWPAAAITQHSWVFVIKKALEAAVLCQRRKSLRSSLFFYKIRVPVYNLQKLPPHLPLLQVTARLFLNVYKTSSSEFPVHGQTQLRQFPVLLLSLKKSSTHPYALCP